jgi:hypothetical protein
MVRKSERKHVRGETREHLEKCTGKRLKSKISTKSKTPLEKSLKTMVLDLPKMC